MIKTDFQPLNACHLYNKTTEVNVHKKYQIESMSHAYGELRQLSLKFVNKFLVGSVACRQFKRG